VRQNHRDVLILSPSFYPNLGGVETHLDDLCEYLRTNDYRVYVLTYQPLITKVRGLRLEKKKEGLEIRRISWPGFDLFHKLEPYPILKALYLTPRLLWAAFWFLLFHQTKIGAIHAHGLNATLVARIVNMFFRKRTTMSTHAIYDLRGKSLMAKIIKWIMNRIDTIMAVTEKSKIDLMTAEVPEDRIKVYTQWVNQELFKPRDKTECRRKLRLDGEFFALFVGRLIEKKGAKVLLEVAENLPEIKFVFVGDGPTLGDLKIAENQLRNIYVVGRKNQQETALYYGAADVIVIPSQYEEPFGRVVLESLSSGRPVIAANKGSLPEIVTSEVGILVDPAAENITEALKSLHNDSKIAKRLTENARAYALRYFSEENAQLIADTYGKIQ